MTTVAPSIARRSRDRSNGSKADSSSMKFYRRLFSDSPERSIRVRVLALLASLWAATTLILVGASLIVPLVTMPAFVIGHIVAYKAITRRIPALPLVIALIIIVVGVAMRHELVLAVRGERVPVAHFLLIAGSASVFEARTRAGLYTQIFFSALIMFFASELAFGNEFALLLGGYMAIIVTFLALSQYTDITRASQVTRKGGIPGAAAFWAAVATVVAASSFVAFLLLPWDASQAPDAARFAILPVNGAGNGSEQPISPEEARKLIEQAAAQFSQGNGEFDGSGLSAGAGITGGSAISGQSGGSNVTGATAGTGIVTARPAGTRLSAPDLEEGTVAHIRSAVASYWRGAVYDAFDSPASGGTGEWVSTLPDRRRLGSLFAQPGSEEETERYLQTFFMQQGLGSSFITGYEPLSISIPRDSRGLPSAGEGSTYQVVSSRPAISPEELQQDQGGWSSSEYSALPPGYGDVYALARALTTGAETDFERASAIAGYLNGLEYDPESTTPLESSADLTEFVFGERPGSAIDFATAQALMSRAVGLQSRVATGFLPGTFNPYSGAAEIGSSDLHAWAEVLFENAGWVPFDASSRPDLPNPSSLEKPPPSAFSSMLDRRLGDDLASALNGSPGGLAVIFKWLLQSGPLFGAVIMLLTAVAGLAYWWYWVSKRKKATTEDLQLIDYSALAGPDRNERMRIIKAFARVEKRVVKAGFRKRRDSEPVRLYAERASSYLLHGGEEYVAAASVVEQAAYSRSPITAGTAKSFERDMKSLKVKGGIRTLSREPAPGNPDEAAS